MNNNIILSEHIVPPNFLGLRILLLDSDTPSLLEIESQLQFFSYRVTTTELPTAALSILQERADSFDLVMAEMVMPGMDCLEFIKSVHLIKDIPIILMSAEEADKSVVEDALMKGASYFLSKPISPKNLGNVWQHFYRDTHGRNARRARVEVNNVIQIADTDEEVGDSDEAMNEHGGLADVTNGKRAMPSPENDEAGENKRRRMEGESSMASQDSHRQNLFLTTTEKVEFAPSTSANQEASSSKN